MPECQFQVLARLGLHDLLGEECPNLQDRLHTVLLILDVSMSKQDATIFQEDHNRTSDVLVPGSLGPLHTHERRAEPGDVIAHQETILPAPWLRSGSETGVRATLYASNEEDTLWGESFPPVFGALSLVRAPSPGQGPVARPVHPSTPSLTAWIRTLGPTTPRAPIALGSDVAASAPLSALAPVVA